MNLFDELNRRGIIKQLSSPDIETLLNSTSISFYCGFDPTSDSLHVGSLLPLVTMKRLQNAGHRAICLAGSATGLIGDPSFKASERSMLTEEQISENLKGIEKNIKTIIDCKMVSNIDWFSPMSFISFLRTTGKMFTINHMMAKESVKSRLEDREQGISFTEFSYMLLQAEDFRHLCQTEDCVLQIGGSDQWGNITAGIELTRKTLSQQVFGMTMPLLTKADGTKFGKSEGSNVWLSKDKTSVFDFYQFFLNTDDKDTVKLLKSLTFISLEEIKVLEHSLHLEPHLRMAQKALAAHMTEMVHGSQGLTEALEKTKAILLGAVTSIDFEKEKSLVVGSRLIDLLFETGLSSSKTMARKEIEGKAISIFNEKVLSPDLIISDEMIKDKMLVLKKGKMTTKVIKIV